jgi:hypothetical protein
MSNNETDVVDALYRPRLSTFRELMNGEIVGPGGQIDVFLVRLPLHMHSEN